MADHFSTVIAMQECERALLELEPLFADHCRITLLIRNPRSVDGDILFSRDDLAQVVAAIQRLQKRPPVAAAGDTALDVVAKLERLEGESERREGLVTVGWAQPGAHGKRERCIVYHTADRLTIVREGGRRIVVDLDAEGVSNCPDEGEQAGDVP